MWIDKTLNFFGAASREALTFIADQTTSVVAATAKPVPTQFALGENGASTCFDTASTLELGTSKKIVEEENTPACTECGAEFGITLYRYHCKCCNHAFCDRHLPHKAFVPFRGNEKQERVCGTCFAEISHNEHMHRLAWRLARTQAFFDGSLEPWSEIFEDTTADIATRSAIYTFAAVSNLPFVNIALKTTAAATAFLLENGAVALEGFLLHTHFSEAAATMKAMAAPYFQETDVGMVDFVGAFYYQICQERFQRGCDPDLPLREHRACPKLPAGLLSHILHVAPYALHLAYQDGELQTTVDLQRLTQHLGAQLLFATLVASPGKPAWFLVANSESQEAILTVRGTQSLHDALTDLTALPKQFPDHWDISAPEGPHQEVLYSGENTNSHVAHGGVLHAALWLLAEVGLCLHAFHVRGFRVVLTGHSLGAGCAAVLAVLLRPFIPNIQAICFAPPACVNSQLAAESSSYITSVVLGDDIVPRGNTANAGRLLQRLNAEQHHWRELWAEDRRFLTDRAVRAWEPRRRARMGKLQKEAQQQAAAEAALGAQPASIVEKAACADLVARGSVNEVALEEELYLGSRDTSLARVARLMGMGGSARFLRRTRRPLADPPLLPAEKEETNDQSDTKSECVPLEDESQAVQVPAGPVSLCVPGTVVHVYSWRGMWEAAIVSHDFATLNRVELSTTMLRDHQAGAYMEALRVVAQRQTGKCSDPPAWTAFDQRNNCALCCTDFTWGSTSHSIAQQAMDRHNCRHCGELVCPGCSTHTLPLPQAGMPFPVRCCDRCFVQPPML
eukprot:TRINITY_DN8269_c0_g1_i1.p1 TRINITY_DN8269_c0_g1~~TRINITY_DN8269_c0_g1_i1.p1  ORF type:complete len:804 (+),score=90.02 TRINITY_DN8269_c0_g1_i1:38-2413(+)